MPRPKLEGGIVGRNLYLTEDLDKYVYAKCTQMKMTRSEFMRSIIKQHRDTLRAVARLNNKIYCECKDSGSYCDVECNL